MSPTLMLKEFWNKGEKRKRPPLRARLIGLYEGGHVYDRGVYRPAGVCIMREQWGVKFGLYRFCHVCSYLLVDKINPIKHESIDADYARVYSEL